MGVVIEICIKYPGGPTRITVTDIIQYNTALHGTVLVLVQILAWY
jgi:hypothetical protein